MTTPEIPVVAPGTVLVFPDTEWRYGSGDLYLRVGRVRAELAHLYGGHWVWIDGERTTPDGEPLGGIQALVKTEALRRSVSARN